MSTDRWTPGRSESRCVCGNVVSQRFIDVFGRKDGSLYACLECSTRDALARGAGYDPSFERRCDTPLRAARKKRGDTPRAMGGDE